MAVKPAPAEGGCRAYMKIVFFSYCSLRWISLQLKAKVNSQEDLGRRQETKEHDPLSRAPSAKQQAPTTGALTAFGSLFGSLGPSRRGADWDVV